MIPICGAGERYTCVVDGDTLWLEGEKIRLVGIDAPELGEPECAAEAALAWAATERLARVLSAGEVSVSRQGEDRYGRTLARIAVAGRDAGDVLVLEGLARRWAGRREGWCR